MKKLPTKIKISGKFKLPSKSLLTGKPNTSGKRRFHKQSVILKNLQNWARESQFLATTLSIVLTFGTANVLERCQRAEDRELSALMVMSNIEQFSRQMEKKAEEMAQLDSIATWMLSLPKDSLDMIPIDEMKSLINQVVTLDFLNHDKSAEGIFSSGIETWKNMGYFQFIDNVGACFSRMNADIKYWNEWVEEYENTIYDVLEHPDEHPGKHTYTKLLNNQAFRTKIESFHVRKEYLEYSAAYYRYLNAMNMRQIGIDSCELIAFTEEHANDLAEGLVMPQQSDYRKPQLKRDSLSTLRPVIMHFDSILQGKMPPKPDKKLNKEESVKHSTSQKQKKALLSGKQPR